MATVRFTSNLARHVAAPERQVDGANVRKVLEAVFEGNPLLRGYVLDDQGRVRRHVAVFVNGELIRDRNGLGDPVGEADEVYVMQALPVRNSSRSELD